VVEINHHLSACERYGEAVRQLKTKSGLLKMCCNNGKGQVVKFFQDYLIVPNNETLKIFFLKNEKKSFQQMYFVSKFRIHRFNHPIFWST